jgi:hypothetical protein
MTEAKAEAFMRMNDAEGLEFMRSLDEDELLMLEQMVNETLEEMESIADPNVKALAYVADEIVKPGSGTKPQADPAASLPALPKAAPKPALGLGKDGIYRCTESQFRNPAWCYRTQAERQGKVIETVPE